MKKKESNRKYIVKNTKICTSLDQVFDRLCEIKGSDTYHVLQWFAYTFIRASSPLHELSPEIQKLMTLMECEYSWQHAFNLCNPDGLKVSQVVLILEQQKKKGFGAVMVDKPFMDSARQTECVDDIVERMLEVCMPGVWRRLRLLAAEMQCTHLSDLLITMIERQRDINLEDADRAEMTGPGNYTDFGRVYEYGRKTKSVHHKTIKENEAKPQKIQFKPEDTPEEFEPDFRPFGEEW